MKKRFWSVAASVTAGVLLATACISAEAAPLRLKFGIAVSENSTWFQGAKKFADLIQERTGGKYVVDLFPSDQLAAGNIIKGLEMLRMGATDIDMRSTIIYTTVDPKFTVPLMPWLVPSYEEADKALAGKGGKMLSDLVRQKGIVPLAFGESGFRQVTNNVRPILAPADIKGLKIRIPTNKMYIAMFRALGADPTSINFGELFAALQQGTADGQENPPDVIASARVQEVQKYMTMWNASYDPIIMSASATFWGRLSDAEKSVFEKAALEAMAYQKKISREKNDQLVTDFKAKMTIAELTPEQVKAFRIAVQPVYDEYEKLVGLELLEAFGYKK